MTGPNSRYWTGVARDHRTAEGLARAAGDERAAANLAALAVSAEGSARHRLREERRELARRAVVALVIVLMVGVSALLALGGGR